MIYYILFSKTYVAFSRLSGRPQIRDKPLRAPAFVRLCFIQPLMYIASASQPFLKNEAFT